MENLVEQNLKAGTTRLINGMNRSSEIYYYKLYTDKFQKLKNDLSKIRKVKAV